ALERRELAPDVHERRVAARDLAGGHFEPSELVEQLVVRLRVQERLLVPLPMDVDEVRSQVAQEREGDELIVDVGPAAGAVGDLATHDRPAVPKLDSGLAPKTLERRVVFNAEYALEKGRRLPAPNDVGRGPRPEQQAECVDED